MSRQGVKYRSCEMHILLYRDVAQFGRVPRSGRGGRRFKSCHPDLKNRSVERFFVFRVIFRVIRFPVYEKIVQNF